MAERTLECPTCRAEFTAARSDSRYCSPRCGKRARYVHRNTFHQKRCEHCGGEFVARRSDARFCSRRCIVRNRKGSPAVQLCEGCGADISDRMGNARYCGACYVNREKAHEAGRARLRTCVRCGREFLAKTNREKHCGYRCAGLSSRAKQLANRWPVACAACGSIFMTADTRATGCSTACKLWAKKHPGIPRRLGRQCRTCGGNFEARTMAQRFCSTSCVSAAGKEIRRTRMRGLPFELVSRAEILARDRMTCHLCGGRIHDRASLDHIIPLSDPRCPGHVWENLAAAHGGCNSKKGGRARPSDLALYNNLREARLQRG